MTETQTHDSGAHPLDRPDEQENATPESVDMLTSNARDVVADRVTMAQSSAGTVSGSRVRVNQSAIRSLTMATGSVTQSATAMLTSTDMAMHDSAAGIVNAARVDLFTSRVGILRGPVTVRDGSAKVLLHIGPSDPSIRPILSGDSALKLGAGLGVTWVVLSRLLRRLRGN